MSDGSEKKMESDEKRGWWRRQWRGGGGVVLAARKWTHKHKAGNDNHRLFSFHLHERGGEREWRGKWGGERERRGEE